MYRNDRDTCIKPEEEMLKKQNEFKGMDFYQVDTAKAPDIRDQYADGGNKPYFKFYRNGTKIDQIDYKSNFNDNMYSLKTKCETHDSKEFACEKYTLARASFKGLKKT